MDSRPCRMGCACASAPTSTPPAGSEMHCDSVALVGLQGRAGNPSVVREHVGLPARYQRQAGRRRGQRHPQSGNGVSVRGVGSYPGGRRAAVRWDSARRAGSTTNRLHAHNTAADVFRCIGLAREGNRVRDAPIYRSGGEPAIPYFNTARRALALGRLVGTFRCSTTRRYSPARTNRRIDEGNGISCRPALWNHGPRQRNDPPARHDWPRPRGGSAGGVDGSSSRPAPRRGRRVSSNGSSSGTPRSSMEPGHRLAVRWTS